MHIIAKNMHLCVILPFSCFSGPFLCIFVSNFHLTSFFVKKTTKTIQKIAYLQVFSRITDFSPFDSFSREIQMGVFGDLVNRVGLDD